MNRRTRLLLVATLAAGLAMTVGSGGFSAVNADRGFLASLAEDPDAYLGVGIEVDESGGDDPRTAISYVGFCGEGDGGSLDPSVSVTEYKPGAEPTAEPLVVTWTTDWEVSTVVLKTGGGQDALENFAGGTSGTIEVGNGTPAGGDQETAAQNYCPDGEDPLGKVESDEFGVDGDATAVDGDDGNATVTLRVTNQFPENTTLDVVRVTVAGTTKRATDLATGESATLSFRIDCDGTVVADVHATGPEVTVDLEPRSVC